MNGLFGAAAAPALVVVAVFFSPAGNYHIAPGDNGRIATGLEGAADARDIAPSVEFEGARGFKAGGVAHHVVAQLIAISFTLEGGDSAFVDDVASQRGCIDFAPRDHPATAVADGVGGEHIQAVDRHQG